MKSFRTTRTSGFGSAGLSVGFLLLALLVISPGMARAADEPLRLQDLIDEGLKNSPELRAFESRVEASKYRIPQAKSLPDPMLMFGYQNEGFRRITIGEELGPTGHVLPLPDVLLPGKALAQGGDGNAGCREACRAVTVRQN